MAKMSRLLQSQRDCGKMSGTEIVANVNRQWRLQVAARAMVSSLMKKLKVCQNSWTKVTCIRQGKPLRVQRLRRRVSLCRAMVHRAAALLLQQQFERAVLWRTRAGRFKPAMEKSTVVSESTQSARSPIEIGEG